MEANETPNDTQEKKSNLKKYLIFGAIALFVLFAVLTPTPQEQKAETKPAETVKTVQPEEKKPVVRTVWDDGTYEVGKDIAVGKYKSVADNCYWSISNDANGSDIIQNGMQSGQQIVELSTPGQYFTVQSCNFELAS